MVKITLDSSITLEDPVPEPTYINNLSKNYYRNINNKFGVLHSLTYPFNREKEKMEEEKSKRV